MKINLSKVSGFEALFMFNKNNSIKLSYNNAKCLTKKIQCDKNIFQHSFRLQNNDLSVLF